MIHVRVYCDEPSHEGRVAKLTTLGDTGPVNHGDGTVDGVVLVDEMPRPTREVYGSMVDPPDATIDPARVRQRDAITCPLCGLRWESRRERTQEIAKRLHAAGVSRISLRALVATL